MLLQLTEQEMLEAGLIGLQRTIKSRVQCLDRAKHGLVPNEWEIDILGAMAERALAKALDVYPGLGVNTFHAPDVGDLQVRSTLYATGKLILRPGDAPGTYVLVITQPPKFKIAGIYQFTGKGDPADWAAPDQKRPGCWAVPQDRLASLETLKNQKNP